MSKDFERLLPQMLGALPAAAGVPTEKDLLMLKLMGGLAACAGVAITKNPDGGYGVVVRQIKRGFIRQIIYA